MYHPIANGESLGDNASTFQSEDDGRFSTVESSSFGNRPGRENDWDSSSDSMEEFLDTCVFVNEEEMRKRGLEAPLMGSKASILPQGSQSPAWTAVINPLKENPKTSIKAAVFSLVSSMVGGGTLSIPFAFQAAG